ncbi:MAG: hypothetical protein WC452_07140, partial [Aminobacteriaceae bacterium]
NEVADYVYLSPVRAPSDPQVFFVNKDAWNALPKDLQLLVQTFVDRFAQAQHEYLVYESIVALEKFKKAGNQVLKVPAEVNAALAAEADKFYAEKVAKEPPIFGEIYNSMKAFGEAYETMK